MTEMRFDEDVVILTGGSTWPSPEAIYGAGSYDGSRHGRGAWRWTWDITFSASDNALRWWQPVQDMTGRAQLNGFVAMLGSADWSARMSALIEAGRVSPRAGRATLQRHCIELTIERLRSAPLKRLPSAAECRIMAATAEALTTLSTLSALGQDRFLALLRANLAGQGCLIEAFHLLRVAAMRRLQGFDVEFAGFEIGAPLDLLVRRGGIAMEIACETVSAEEGRAVTRSAWLRLMDALQHDLQAWLGSHPGRYLMKMTLHGGLNDQDDAMQMTVLARIRDTLHRRTAALSDADATIRLERLTLPAADADGPRLLPRLRHEFGAEAHLAVISAGTSILALAARAGCENDVATAVSRHLQAATPTRLSGRRPGIIALFIEDVDQLEWRLLRETLSLEAAIRQFLTRKEASCVAAVSCTSRLELFEISGGETEGELRFRNPGNPAAKLEALAPAVSSTG